jgi:NADPH:quinone reductase-like Zn-dependent oxidoreductase
MRAIVYTKYGPPEVLQLREVEKPAPKDNEVLIKVCAAVVTAADSAMRKGEPFIGRFFTGFGSPKMSILGCELAGEIEVTGKDARRFKAGDQVFASTNKLGTYAEYVCLPDDGALAIKPANMTYGEAAAVCDGAMTALPFLRDEGKIQSGQKILVIGASGAVGTFAVQLGKYFGAEVTAVCRGAEYFGAEVTAVCRGADKDLAESLGAANIIDYTKEDFTQSGRTYDIIFDTVGKSSFTRCKGSLTPSGIYLTTVPTWAIFPQMLWTSVFSRKKAIFTPTGLRSSPEKSKDLIILRELIEAGKIRSVIDRSYPLEQLAEAHRYVEKGHKKGSVVIALDLNNKAT